MFKAPKMLRSIVKAREVREDQLLAEVARLAEAAREARRRLDDGLHAIELHERGAVVPTRVRSPWLGLAREYRRREALRRPVLPRRTRRRSHQRSLRVSPPS